MLELIGIVLGFCFWIAALVHAARNAHWTWFVVMLVLWPAAIFYPLQLRERRKSKTRRRNREARLEERQKKLVKEVSDLRMDLDEVRSRAKA